MRVPRVVDRKLSKFMRNPPSVRSAAAVIVAATALVVVAGGVLIRIIDHEEYSNIWVGMWWALQTVTTVGYGDVTPTHRSGRLVGAVVMLQGIAFLAIVTAVITSTFVARAALELHEEDADAAISERELMERRFDDLERKLDSLAALQRPGGG